MKRCAIVATHHKTGTAWMSSTFKRICKVRKIRFVHMDIDPVVAEGECAPPVVFFSGHANFRNYPWLRDSDYPIFHLIRDPRDVVISGMHYHRKSKERWLHVPQDEFDGLTYQQKLNSLPDERTRLEFEMRNSAARTVASMLRWNYNDPRSYECKYEELIADVEGELFARICTHLGFGPKELIRCKGGFMRNSIFGEKKKRKGRTLHIRSGDPQQWPCAFNRELGKAFLAAFGDALVRLGYEQDDHWVDRLSEQKPDQRAAAT